jgi:hypothetical protein
VVTLMGGRQHERGVPASGPHVNLHSIATEE